jgi:hypothetical protein
LICASICIGQVCLCDRTLCQCPWPIRPSREIPREILPPHARGQNRVFAGLLPCRRRDSNPRHADYDCQRVWAFRPVNIGDCADAGHVVGHIDHESPRYRPCTASWHRPGVGRPRGRRVVVDGDCGSLWAKNRAPPLDGMPPPPTCLVRWTMLPLSGGLRHHPSSSTVVPSP